MNLPTRDECERLMSPGSHIYLHPDEIEPICRHASASKLLVEIGTGYGGCASYLLMSAPANARVHSVDPFVADTFGGWKSTPEITTDNVNKLATQFGFDTTRWTLHTDYSYNVVIDAPHKVNFLFLDADHTYEGVKRDFEEWLPLVIDGGVILLHDSRRVPNTPDKVFDHGWPGPTQLANELRNDARIELVEEVYSLTVWRKRATEKPAVKATRKKAAK